MIYTALAVLFLVICSGIGAFGGPRVTRPHVAAALAAAMVAAQFVALTGR